ncbi:MULTISPECIES: class I SAM-dependent methyltransferase [unclassified Mycobacterium]|uniref:class I SAM-dependent methyltransferase n=1 Tax=unclassified Mycobacterium TaxID=2642494 RepID=UPI00073FB984|nr:MULTISPECIES: class I SAM-dependent methyltransferase [unclassified Mycobacterium]KUH80892.1 biotin carboxyl carrier protein [Mycobacterium sp. GA-0227b]KUH92315.1 biotin carboxyl carrier protein [Mycobacterium sp. GA-1999]
MNRIEAVQLALDQRASRVYLEIGVNQGMAFRCITTDEKIAVDPVFKMSARSRELSDAKARATHYFETASNDFFANETALLEERKVDVALIDGLHTYPQALLDIENTLQFLRDDGVIFVHDCNPARAFIGCPATSYADFLEQNRWRRLVGRVFYLPWSGDVWKAIVHLRSARDDLRVIVLDCDRGVGVVRKGTPESRLSYSEAEIKSLDYADLAADRDRLLNLRPPAYLQEFLGS